MNLVLRNRHGFPTPFSFRRIPADGSIEHLIDTMFDGYFSPTQSKAATGATGGIAPRINITESESAYVVEAEIPGVSKENVKISIEGKRVTLEAEVKRDTERKEGETLVFAERTAEKFVRSFTLSSEVDDEKTVAKLENGILTLTLPKRAELQPKKILVQ